MLKLKTEVYSNGNEDQTWFEWICGKQIAAEVLCASLSGLEFQANWVTDQKELSEASTKSQPAMMMVPEYPRRDKVKRATI